MLLWTEFLVSIGVSIAFLCWATALLFSLLCAVVFLSPRIASWLGGRFASQSWLVRVEHKLGAVTKRDRLVGTVLNLLASAGSVTLLSVIQRRPLDSWDIGIQIGVAVAVEMIVLGFLFSQGRLRWPLRRTPREDHRALDYYSLDDIIG
jgi:hypothetical protein